uniref:Secreted protein n=1 Tax=Macrostomum lignano TaxID=282301 RepID=A0A1I8GR22_9PLAT
TAGSSGDDRRTVCRLPLAAVTAGSSGDDRRTVCCLPLAAVTAGSLLRVLSSTSVEMRLSNVHYAAADAQDAECNQDPREVKEDDSDDFDMYDYSATLHRN